MNYPWGICTLFLAVTASARADLAVIAASKDNTLYESSFGDISNGAGSYIFTGTTGNGAIRRGLIGFDVAGAIPAGSVIESVRLTLHMSRTPAASEPVSLHRVSADWGEGTSVGFGEEGGGAPATPGDATWIHRFWPSTFWDQPGGDLNPIASATRQVIGNGFYTWGTTPALVADVQAWLDDPDSNFGWAIIGHEAFVFTAKRFDSRENPDPTVRPALTVEYTPIPEPAGLTWLAAVLACIFRSRRR